MIVFYASAPRDIHTPATLAEGCCGGPEVAILGVLLFPVTGLAWTGVCAPGLFGMLAACPPGRMPGTGMAGSLLGSIPGKSDCSFLYNSWRYFEVASLSEGSILLSDPSGPCCLTCMLVFSGGAFRNAGQGAGDA